MSVSSSPRSINIFISYDTDSKRDKNLFNDLTKHLSLVRSQYTCRWYESEVSPGSHALQFSETRLNTADLIILLVSADFFSSPQCFEFEMKRALALKDSRNASILSIKLRPSEWANTPLNRYTPLPSNGKPITRWPDRDSAFLDVVQGIRQAINALTSQEITPMHDSPQHIPVCDPPYTYDDLFTDRVSILDNITSRLSSSRSHRTSLLALSGVGGIGKTSIALEYCYKTKISETYQNMWWFNASSLITLSTDVNALAEQLSLPHGVRENEQQLFATIKHWLRDQPRWFIVLDNIEDMALINLIIPPLSSGHVLLTTRLQDIKKRISVLLIPSMEIDDGALFLLRRMQMLSAQEDLNQVPPDTRQAACAMARAMNGFPLALDQAGAYLKEQEGDLATYLNLYPRQQEHLFDEHGQEEEDTRYTAVIGYTYLFAIEHFKGTPILDLLYLLAFLHFDTISEMLLVHGAQALDGPLRSFMVDAVTLYQALSDLRSYSLVRYHADRAVLQIPRPVQDVIIRQLTEEQQRFWAQQAVRLVNCVFPEVRFDTLDICKRYQPQAAHCATLIKQFQLTLNEGALLLERLGSFCLRYASYHNAETYLHQALELSQRHLNSDVLETAQILNSLGLLYRRRASYKQAETFHQQALKLREQKLGPDHPKTAQSQHNLASVYGDLGKYQEAERIYLHVLAIEERTENPDDPDIADTLSNLGLTYSQQGIYVKAEKAYKRALHIYKQTLASDHPDLAYPLNGLGNIAEKRGHYTQAKKYYQQALTIRQDAFGEQHPEIARSMSKLAGVAELTHDYKQAESLYQQALKMSEQLLGSRHPDVAAILNNLALLATRQQQYKTAAPLYQQALKIYKLVLGSEHPAVASVLNNLGQFSRMMQKEQRAEKLLRQALTIRKKVLNATHPSIAQSLANLADLLADQQRYEEAESLFQQAFTHYLQLPDPKHPDVIQMPEKYAVLLEHTGRHEEAHMLRQAANEHGDEKKQPSNERFSV